MAKRNRLITETKSKIFGYIYNNKLVGAISINNGAIQFLSIQKKYRNKGIAKSLIKRCVDLDNTKIRMSFSNNSSLELYLKKNNFKKEPITQYEMYSNFL
ncbi:GNAT family N-acetyltransferase [Clostridium estertheticum]|uniref:GNAT family N-acetyltransferase n=1 Tax=Clostridium estertheticum TaxID=238834 RepID=UPI0013E95B92|nr:GNAT family N-acetyltransferase [Clostridium estertheticum]